MTADDGEPPAGFLTEAHRAYLAGKCDESTRETCRTRLRETLPAVLEDLALVWRFLPDEDLKAVFADAPKSQIHGIRGATEPIIALLYYAAKLNGDDIDYRIAEATKAAEAVRGNHAEVDYDVRTTSILSPAETITRLEETDGAHQAVSVFEQEQLLMAPEVAPERVASLFASGEGGQAVEVLADEIRELRAADESASRPPFATIVNASACTESEDDTDGEWTAF